jgi:lactoylglutathione lyase
MRLSLAALCRCTSGSPTLHRAWATSIDSWRAIPGVVPMRIEHIAIWTADLDRCIKFYVSYFGAAAGPRYVNPAKGFESCFLHFADGARLEAMTTTTLSLVGSPPGAQRLGLTHLAISVGSERVVDELTARLRVDGYSVVDGPRRTGDGYYESVIIDPDGNRIEICS